MQIDSTNALIIIIFFEVLQNEPAKKYCTGSRSWDKIGTLDSLFHFLCLTAVIESENTGSYEFWLSTFV